VDLQTKILPSSLVHTNSKNLIRFLHLSKKIGKFPKYIKEGSAMSDVTFHFSKGGKKSWREL
jgi:hypothetical protein